MSENWLVWVGLYFSIGILVGMMWGRCFRDDPQNGNFENTLAALILWPIPLVVFLVCMSAKLSFVAMIEGWQYGERLITLLFYGQKPDKR